MKSNRTIKIKALFLLAIFSLNTVVGFACSLGLDMGFNSRHHSHEESEKQEHVNGHHHEGNKSHSHQHGPVSHHHTDSGNNIASFSSPGEENCCTDFVVGFQNTDKQIAEKSSIPQKGTNTLLYLVFAPPSAELLNAKGFAEHSRIPPREIDYSPPDIRVFIQSFLI
ncbi:MAG: hypothetical protein J0H85_04555 [Sediminibacterium magnilacihabitans]|jgi:hypothetical protein|nr:hypothetical protein [Sediminibacterium magnilacihabitans]PQV61827.1 hypothetical protein CLV53_101101 [Sediminibacterium magnilacihabitans]